MHPLVLLSVTDHHARSISKNSKKRVVGVLLGQDNGKIINVANSFGIPFEEDEKDSKTWFLDHNYIEGMYDMFRKVNGEWWMACATASLIQRPSSGTIDWLVSYRPQTESVRPRNQRSLQTLHCPTSYGHRRRATTNGRHPNRCIFWSGGNQRCKQRTHTDHSQLTSTPQDGTETRKTFLHVPSAIEAEEAEEIGVEHLLRDIKDSTTTTLATRVSEQLASLRGLQSRIDDIRKYLADVASGAMPVNHQIIYHLQDALNLLPDLSETTTTQSFASSTNDRLLVVYLSSLLRAVIALHALVDNKASIGRAEMAEGDEKDKKARTDGKKGEKDEKETAKGKGKDARPSSEDQQGL